MPTEYILCVRSKYFSDLDKDSQSMKHVLCYEHETKYFLNIAWVH